MLFNNEIGGGRHSAKETNPELLQIVQKIIADSTDGSPEDERLYKNISLGAIQNELEKLEYLIAKNTVGTIV